MSFVAVELPRNIEDEKVDLKSCMQILFNDESKGGFYIDTTRKEDARKLAFDEICKDIILKEAIGMVQEEINKLSKEDNSEYIVHNFGIYDGQIMIKIIDDIRLRSEYPTQSAESNKIDERLYELSIDTIRELCFENSSYWIGLMEVKKNLRKIFNRNEEEQEEVNPFWD